jgi:hypothetical protein
VQFSQLGSCTTDRLGSEKSTSPHFRRVSLFPILGFASMGVMGGMWTYGTNISFGLIGNSAFPISPFPYFPWAMFRWDISSGAAT